MRRNAPAGKRPIEVSETPVVRSAEEKELIYSAYTNGARALDQSPEIEDYTRYVEREDPEEAEIGAREFKREFTLNRFVALVNEVIRSQERYRGADRAALGDRRAAFARIEKSYISAGIRDALIQRGLYDVLAFSIVAPLAPYRPVARSLPFKDPVIGTKGSGSMRSGYSPSGLTYAPAPSVNTEEERILIHNAYEGAFRDAQNYSIDYADFREERIESTVLGIWSDTWIDDLDSSERRSANALRDQGILQQYVMAGTRDGLRQEGIRKDIRAPRAPFQIVRSSWLEVEPIRVVGGKKKSAPTKELKTVSMAKASKAQQEVSAIAFRDKVFPVEGYCDADSKRQYRRTSEPRPLLIPVRKDDNERRAIGGIEELTSSISEAEGTFGILVNPRTGHPVMAEQRDGEYVHLYGFDPTGGARRRDMFIGYGYFHTESTRNAGPENYSFSTMATGYPRVHTPGGVKEKGGGFGTVLYSALCLASHLDWCGVRPFKLEREGIYDGVSSMPGKGRTDSAERWWNSALVDFNLAYEVNAANPFRGDELFGECDVYEYRALMEANIVVAWRPLLGIAFVDRTVYNEWKYDKGGDGKYSGSANRKAIVNMNLSAISQDHFDFFYLLASGSGATKKELDGMKHRFATKTDISWKYGSKSKCKPSGGLGGMEWSASGQTREGLMRASEMPEEYARLAQERADLGWPFMGDD